MPVSIGDAMLKLGVDTKDLDKGLRGVGASIKKHQKAIGIGMVAAGGAMLAGLGVSLKAAVDFESAMREVNTMIGLSQEEFTDFSKDVQGLAADLGVDAVDSAKALYQAISAGVPRENVLTFLEIATKAAIGGVTDTETAVDGLTTGINAFKLPMSDAQKVADLMFTTVKGGKTTFEELSASLFQVAPIAAASGVSFEEVSAALATMTKQGVPTKIATTQLRQAMVALQKPTEDMNKVIRGLGYESGQTMVKELGLAATLNKLKEATSGSNEMLMKMFGSVEAGQAVLALTGDNALMFAADLKTMAEAEGAATDAFAEMERSATRQMKALKASSKDVMITIGNVLLPILKDLLDMVKPIIENIKEWTDRNPALTRVIVIGAAALGVLLMTLGSLLLLMPGIIAATAAFGITLSAAIWPVTLIAIAIGALIAIGVLLWKNWDDISMRAMATWNNILTYFNQVWQRVSTIFAGIGEAMWKPIKAAIDFIVRYIQVIVDSITRLWGMVTGFFGGTATAEGAIPSNWKKTPRGYVPRPSSIIPRQWAKGGVINEPTLLTSLRTMKPYAIAGEAGREFVTPEMGGKKVNIYVELDGRLHRE